MSRNVKALWFGWIFIAIVTAVYLGIQLFAEPQKPDFLIGQTTHGHHQIELKCDTCHESAFGGADVIQDACENCHAQELKMSQDSHPKSKFTDPRNIETLEKIDARYCASCHIEHNPEITFEMGVSQPDDFCFHCHQDIAQDRPSHQGMEFVTCATSGCHNFHDNRALYEDFLVKHADGLWLKPKAELAQTDVLRYVSTLVDLPTNSPKNVFPKGRLEGLEAIQADWQMSAHAEANIGCNDCHGDAQQWVEKPNKEVCGNCHKNQQLTFQQGKHGMRLAQNMSPMTPQQSILAHGQLSFNQENVDKELSCSSCHDVHRQNTKVAAVESCLGCHSDQHSLGFKDSKHGQLWQQHLNENLPETQAVSCATCHMPRLEFELFGQSHTLVQHNQNDNLRPNEKMIRSVCLNCHSISFSIDSLADKELINKNFLGTPKHHIQSVDMSLERADTTD